MGFWRSASLDFLSSRPRFGATCETPIFVWSMLRTQGMASGCLVAGDVSRCFCCPEFGSRRPPSFYEGGHSPYFVHLFTESASSRLIFTWSVLHCSCLPPSAKILFFQMWNTLVEAPQTCLLPRICFLELHLGVRMPMLSPTLASSLHTCAKHLLPTLLYTFKAPSPPSNLLDS